MFVAISSHDGAHIDRISMDGRVSSRIHFIENNLLGPLSLHFDPSLDRLYWADQMRGEISSTDIDGKQIRCWSLLYFKIRVYCKRKFISVF